MHFDQHFVGYLNSLMSELGIWKSFGKSAFSQMQLFPSKLVATCCCALFFKLDDWNQMHSCRHILLAISTTSCLILESESVVECLHSGKCNCCLRIWWRHALAILMSSWVLLSSQQCSIYNHYTTGLSTQMAYQYHTRVTWSTKPFTSANKIHFGQTYML